MITILISSQLSSQLLGRSSLQVGRCCRFDRDRSCVMANWHDLFKYTHMGRAIVAAMTAVRKVVPGFSFLVAFEREFRLETSQRYS